VSLDVEESSEEERDAGGEEEEDNGEDDKHGEDGARMGISRDESEEDGETEEEEGGDGEEEEGGKISFGSTGIKRFVLTRTLESLCEKPRFVAQKLTSLSSRRSQTSRTKWTSAFFLKKAYFLFVVSLHRSIFVSVSLLAPFLKSIKRGRGGNRRIGLRCVCLQCSARLGPKI